MKKIKSGPIFDNSDFPISVVRRQIFSGAGIYSDEASHKPLIGIVNSRTDINPGHARLSSCCVVIIFRTALWR